MSDLVETLVIGAGPAGLTTAYTLAKQGRQVIVLEAGPRLRRRHQPHRRATRASCSTSAAIASSRSRRRSSISGTRSCRTTSSSARACRASTTSGKFYAYPLKAFEALRNLGLVESAPAWPPSPGQARSRSRTRSTFHQWVRNQFGERLFSIFFKTYTEKVWGMSLRRDLGRLGGAAHQGPEPRRRGARRAAPLARRSAPRRRGGSSRR